MAYQYMVEKQPHCWSLLSALDKQRHTSGEVMCDVRFIKGNDCVYAHRSVLVVSSGYFQGLLSGSFMESQAEGCTNSRMMEMDITECEASTQDLDALLSSIYTGILDLTPGNVMGVTELACFLLVERARDVCQSFLIETLDTHTCLQRLRLAYKYDLRTVLINCQYFVTNRFHDYFIHQSDMLDTPASCLHNMTDIFKYVNLHDMVQFLVSWVDRHSTASKGVCGSEEKSRRLQAASQWLDDTCSKLNGKHLHISQPDLVGSPDVLELLLSHCSQGLKCSSNSISHESKCLSPCGNSGGKQCVDNQMGENCSQLDADFSGANKNTDSSKCKAAHSNVSGSGSCCGIEVKSNDSQCSVHKGEPVDLGGKEEDSGTHRPSKISHTTHEEPSDSSHAVEQCAASRYSTKESDGSTSQDGHDHDGSHADTCDMKAIKACVTTTDGRPDSITGVDRFCSSDSGHRMSRKRSDCTDDHPSCTHSKVLKMEDDALDTLNVLVAFVPNKKSVKFFTASDCEDRPRRSSLEFHVCLYHIRQRKWLLAGSSYFPFKLQDKDSWHVTCVNSNAYFVSLRCRAVHSLNLETMTWTALPCETLLQDMSFGCRVKSLVPIAVDGKLYVLVSDKQVVTEIGYPETFSAQQRYFLLSENNTWKPIADVHHVHPSTPLSIISVSDEKVYVVKATITLKLQKSMLLVQEGHVFDSRKGEITKFTGTTYTTSPMRLMVCNGGVNIVDSEGLHQEFNMDSQEWEKKGEVYISDIKKNRAVVGDQYLPCASHASTCMGPSVWEFFGRPQSLHKSVLIELHLNSENKMFTKKHMPPPFRYVALMTACQLSSKFVAGLQQCRYLHDDEVDWSEHS